MPTIDYLPIAAGPGANVDSQANFNGSGYQTVGFESGIAESAQLNKCWRQSSMIAAAIATFISQTLGIPVLDDGNLAALVTNLTNALLPTTVLKRGSGAGGYSTNSTTYVKVDSASLQYVVTIPTGWKLLIWAAGTMFFTQTNTLFDVALADGALLLHEQQVYQSEGSTINISSQYPWALLAEIAGDGLSHTISLQFGTPNGNTLTILNTSNSFRPTMLFLLTPSN